MKTKTSMSKLFDCFKNNQIEKIYIYIYVYVQIVYDLALQYKLKENELAFFFVSDLRIMRLKRERKSGPELARPKRGS